MRCLHELVQRFDLDARRGCTTERRVTDVLEPHLLGA